MKYMLILPLLALSACVEVDKCADTPYARGVLYATTKQHILRSLVSPSTASFQPLGGRNGATIAHLKQCVFMIDMYVDSQNRMGGTVRTRLTYKVTHDPERNFYFFNRR